MHAVAESGAAIGITSNPDLMPNGRDTTLAQYCEMIAWTAERIGVEHVGIASDFHLDQSPEWFRWVFCGRMTHEPPGYIADLVPAEWDWRPTPGPNWRQRPDDLSKVVVGLEDAGFSNSDVAGILGDNFLRLFESVFGK